MLKKIIVKLTGGIGNQLFQVACGVSLGLKLNVSVEFDDSLFNNDSYNRAPEIFKLGIKLAPSDTMLGTPSNAIYTLTDKTISNIDRIASLPTNCQILVLTGYWQSEEFFYRNVARAISNKLQALYATTDLFAKLSGTFERSLAIHVRRRDYAHMGLVAEEYFLAAAYYLMDKAKISSVVLFSDEPNYSSFFLELGGLNSPIKINSSDDLQDLFLLSRYKHVILSNSSYSWWGAYLGEYEMKKQIIRPEPWLTIDPSVNPCPERWIKVPNATRGPEINKSEIEKFLRLLNNTKDFSENFSGRYL